MAVEGLLASWPPLDAAATADGYWSRGWHYLPVADGRLLTHREVPTAPCVWWTVAARGLLLALHVLIVVHVG